MFAIPSMEKFVLSKLISQSDQDRKVTVETKFYNGKKVRQKILSLPVFDGEREPNKALNPMNKNSLFYPR